MALPTLYFASISPPARFALWTAKYLSVNVVVKDVDLLKGEQRNPAYEKINPNCKVPTLVHDKLVIWDSHAIATYLCDNFSGDSPIYPFNSKQRARINQMLYFNNGTLFPLDSTVMSNHFANGAQTKEELLPYVKVFTGQLDILEYYLNQSSWLAGERISLADLCCFCTISTLNLLIPVNKEVHPYVTDWCRRCETIKYHDEVNFTGLKELQAKLSEYATRR